jgi:hypothetical protein
MVPFVYCRPDYVIEVNSITIALAYSYNTMSLLLLKKPIYKVMTTQYKLGCLDAALALAVLVFHSTIVL